MKYGGKMIVLIYFLFLLLSPAKSFAHSTLLTESPLPNSTLTNSPTVITLTFNERLEKELYYIKVIDSHGKSVTNHPTQMSLTQRQLMLDLPPLSHGIYQVSYKIISADGHPIETTYSFTVGNSASAISTDTDNQLSITPPSKLTHIILYLSRFLFYTSLLGLCGWIFWTLAYPAKTNHLIEFNRKGTALLQYFFLLSLLFMIVMQLNELMDEWSYTNIKSVLLGTTLGYSWLASFGLAVIGLIFIRRSSLFAGLWVVLLLVAKVGNGHAMSFENHLGMAALNVVHLLAAAIWVGGLVYIGAHWRRFHDYTLKFLPVFSKYALLSMLMLILSGTLYTLIILPKIEYLFETQWGLLLCVKIGLMLLVLVIGGILRYYMKKKKSISIKQLVRIDICLMLLILLIVSIFTYLNPLPDPESFPVQAIDSHTLKHSN